MRFGLILVFLSAVILCSSCDSDITGSVSSETIPKGIELGCTVDEDLAHGDCPAIDLVKMCDPFLCKVSLYQTIDEETSYASDYTLPECDRECRAMDCGTIECTGSNNYSELDVSINRDGQISVSGILNDEVVFTCLNRTSCGQ